MSERLRALHAEIEAALNRLRPLFRSHELTFVARNTKAGIDADVIVTNDDLSKVAGVLLEYASREETK